MPQYVHKAPGSWIAALSDGAGQDSLQCRPEACCRRARSRARRRARPRRPCPSGARAPARHAALARPPCAQRTQSCRAYPKTLTLVLSAVLLLWLYTLYSGAERTCDASHTCPNTGGAFHCAQRLGRAATMVAPCIHLMTHRLTFRGLCSMLARGTGFVQAAHPSVLPPSTTMTSRGGGNRLRRWRTHSAMHRPSFSAWHALRRARQRAAKRQQDSRQTTLDLHPKSRCRHSARATGECACGREPVPSTGQGFDCLHSCIAAHGARRG